MFVVLAALCAGTDVSVYYDKASKKYTLGYSYDVGAAACGMFFDSDDASGWMNLHVEANKDNDDEVMAYAAGIVEGYLNQGLYKNYKRNTITNLCNDFLVCEKDQLPADVVAWFTENCQWVVKEVEKAGASSDFAWGAKIVLEQMKGIVDGHNRATSSAEAITLEDLWLIHSRSEMFDVFRKVNGRSAAAEPFIERHATSFVTKAPGTTDLFVAHSSWRSYGDSLKLSKRYRLPYHNEYSTIERRSLSGYPLILHSDEGMTITDQAIVVTATTIAIADDGLFAVMKPQGYPHWFRELVANQISHSGTEWVGNYAVNGTGGCGVEYTVVDMKRFAYGEDLLPNTVTVIDDVPSHIVSGDVTEVIEKNNYFASYDVPYFEEVRLKAGYEALAVSYPEMYSYTESSRAQILKSRAPKAVSRESVRDLIRYNNQSDPLQKNRPDLGISAREELLDDGRCAGAVDSKMTSVPRALHLHWEGAVGPSFTDAPEFAFSSTKNCASAEHTKVPDKLAYNWLGHYFDLDV